MSEGENNIESALPPNEQEPANDQLDESSVDGLGQDEHDQEGNRIPKHRFDEVITERNSVRQENEMLKRLLNQQLQPKAPQAAQEADPLDGEDIDPHTKSILKKVTTHLEGRIKNTEGLLRYSNMKADFMASNPDAAKHMREIEEYCSKQYQQHNAIIPFDTAYEVIRARKLASGGTRRAAQNDVATEAPRQARRQPPVAGPGTAAHAKKAPVNAGGFSDDDLNSVVL